MRHNARKQSRPQLVWLWMAMLGILLWGITASQAAGQVGDRVTDELERTDQVIEKARQAVAESGSERGQALLDNAVRLQERARDHYQRRMYGQAERFTLLAREKALEAMASTRSREENEEAVRRQLERTDEVLANVWDRLADRMGMGPGLGHGRGARGEFPALESLTDRQETAWQYLHEHRLRAALKLTLQVREQLLRFAEQARRMRHGGMDIEQGIGRTRDFLDRARDPIMQSGQQRNIDMFARAEQRFAQAEEASARGQASVAREHLRVCRELLTRALAGIENVANPDQVRQLLDQARARWERLEGAVIDSRDPEMQQRYRRAGEQIDRAESFLQQGELVRALTHARTAVEILDRLEDEQP